jgi:iron complex transport system permease protein
MSKIPKISSDKGKKRFIFPLMILVLAGLFLLSISLGSVRIPFSEILNMLIGKSAEKGAWEIILFEFRIPKAITAILAGAALATSGLQMQTFFRNPLAGPFVLGISSGASLGVALLVLAGGLFGLGLTWDTAIGPWLLIIAAVAGAATVMSLILVTAIRIRDSMTLLIIGLMFGSATGAIVSVLQYFSDATQIQAFLIWTFGSLGNLSWYQLKVFFPVIFVGLLLCVFLAKPLNALLLGESYAKSMGMRLSRVRIGIIISTCLLAGGVTAFCGPIAFIGIAVPHLTKAVLPVSDHRKLFPAVALVGAVVLLVCDMVAQLPGSEQTLPINAVTSLIGAPVVIWVIVRRRSIKNSMAL